MQHKSFSLIYSLFCFLVSLVTIQIYWLGDWERGEGRTALESCSCWPRVTVLHLDSQFQTPAIYLLFGQESALSWPFGDTSRDLRWLSPLCTSSCFSHSSVYEENSSALTWRGFSILATMCRENSSSLLCPGFFADFFGHFLFVAYSKQYIPMCYTPPNAWCDLGFPYGIVTDPRSSFVRTKSFCVSIWSQAAVGKTDFKSRKQLETEHWSSERW